MSIRIPEKLEALRERFGYTQIEIAEKLNISLQEYIRIETGMQECPAGYLVELSYLYDVSIGDLRDDTKEVIPEMIQPINMMPEIIEVPSFDEEIIKTPEIPMVEDLPLLEEIPFEPEEFDAPEEMSFEPEEFNTLEEVTSEPEEPVIPEVVPFPVSAKKEPEPVVEQSVNSVPAPVEEVEEESEEELEEEIDELPVEPVKPVKKPKKKKNPLPLILLLLLMICGAGFAAYKLKPEWFAGLFSKQPVATTEIPKEDMIPEKENYDDLIALWNANKAINDDYIGELYFDSGLVNQPIVQGETNDTYLRTDWKTMTEDSAGTAFLDYRNNPLDQNLIIYGHYVYSFKDPTRTKMFTPLEQLMNKDNYEANKYVNFLLEGELRRYVVAEVYYCDLYEDGGYWYTNENLEYYWTNYDASYFEQYKENVKEVESYSTGIDLSMDDNLLTLQTCVENHDELREIVILKEIDRVKFD